MDTIIQEAASRGIRLIIPMANNWLDEVDSKAKFAEWASGGSVSNPDETFFTSQAARDKYKSHIANMVNRFAPIILNHPLMSSMLMVKICCFLNVTAEKQ